MQNSTPNLSASTDISTLSKDSEIGQVLNLRWAKIERASAKSILDFDKPLGDLLCKLRGALDASQKQIPSKTLNVNNINGIDRRRRSEAERLARDWNVVVSHMDGKTVGEIAESKRFSSTTALFTAVDKPEREAKAAERKAEKEAAKAEAEAEETAKAEEASKPMSADDIVFEAMLLCSVNRVSDKEFIAAVKRQITMMTEAA